MAQYTSAKTLPLACAFVAGLLVCCGGCSTGGYGFRWLPSAWHGVPARGHDAIVVYGPSDWGLAATAPAADPAPRTGAN